MLGLVVSREIPGSRGRRGRRQLDASDDDGRPVFVELGDLRRRRELRLIHSIRSIGNIGDDGVDPSDHGTRRPDRSGEHLQGGHGGVGWDRGNDMHPLRFPADMADVTPARPACAELRSMRAIGTTAARGRHRSGGGRRRWRGILATRSSWPSTAPAAGSGPTRRSVAVHRAKGAPGEGERVALRGHGGGLRRALGAPAARWTRRWGSLETWATTVISKRARQLPRRPSSTIVAPTPAPGWWHIELDARRRTVRVPPGRTSTSERRPRPWWPTGRRRRIADDAAQRGPREHRR